MFVFALSVGLIQSMLQEGCATYPTASGRGWYTHFLRAP